MSNIQAIKSIQNSNILEIKEYAGEVTFIVKLEGLYNFLNELKTNYGFDYLVDIVATDHYVDGERFEVSYNLYNLTTKERIRVKTKVSEEKPEVPSVVSIWPSANWYEREQYDMMGIIFKGHPDLRRIYMPEDFEYFPLRKEFPLLGIPGSIQIPEKDPPKGY
jgi:NADH-quinone oxidoreductase subunit C